MRFLQNEYGSQGRYVLIGLQGTTSNRDGIGARVEVSPDDGQQPLLRTLRAGEGYLGQGSKWLHFGLGSAGIQQVTVGWPSGQREVFHNVEDGGRFVLIEGQGTAVRLPDRDIKLLAAPLAALPKATESSVRLVLPAPMPMPRLACRDLQGQEMVLHSEPKGPLLVNLWSTTCRPCLEEISEWSKRETEFKNTGVRVVLVCVDGATTSSSPLDSDRIRNLVDGMKLPYAVGQATSEFLDALDIAQQVLTRRRRTLPVPTSFLFNQQGRLAVVYKGQATADLILSDIDRQSLSPEDQRNMAVRFPGRWYTLPFPPDFLAIPAKYRNLGRPDRALGYLKRNAPTSIDDPTAESFFNVVSARSLADTYIALAKELQALGKQSDVLESLGLAASLQPQDGRTQMSLAMALQQSGRAGEAVSKYREFIHQNPDNLVMMNNLAWLLATCDVETVRRPEEAIQLAEQVCEQSRRKLPSALDTLAAAYAAAGRFDNAVSTIREAIALLDSSNQTAYSAVMRTRLELYQRKRAYVEKPQ